MDNGVLIAAEGFRARWTDVQTGFVDAPRRAVEQADALVAELMQHLARTFADERGRLESQWDRGDDVPTDDLRTAFQWYRSFFERLLATCRATSRRITEPQEVRWPRSPPPVPRSTRSTSRR